MNIEWMDVSTFSEAATWWGHWSTAREPPSEPSHSSRARVDMHRKDNAGSLEKAITIYDNPENCTSACKRILEVMKTSPTRSSLTAPALTPTRWGTPEAQLKAQYLIFEKIRDEYGGGYDDVKLTVELVIPSSHVGRLIVKDAGAQKQVGSDAPALLCCSTEPVSIKYGINRIWVRSDHRRRGLASSLVNATPSPTTTSPSTSSPSPTPPLPACSSRPGTPARRTSWCTATRSRVHTWCWSDVRSVVMLRWRQECCDAEVTSGVLWCWGDVRSVVMLRWRQECCDAEVTSGVLWCWGDVRSVVRVGVRQGGVFVRFWRVTGSVFARIQLGLFFFFLCVRDGFCKWFNCWTCLGLLFKWAFVQ